MGDLGLKLPKPPWPAPSERCQDGRSRCRAVRRLLIAAAVLLTGPAHAQIDPKIKAECMKAQDFVGCIKALSGASEPKSIAESENLRNTMKQVADRLSFGTSLRESSEIFRPLVDALALAKEKEPSSLAVKVSTKASAIFSIIQSGWQARIDALTVNIIGESAYKCKPTQTAIDLVNQEVGTKAIVPFSSSRNKEVDSLPTGFLTVCSEETVKSNERRMINFVAEILREGSVPQSTIARYNDEAAKSLADLENRQWLDHLKENTKLQAWIKVNPKMAEQKKKEFIAASSTPPQKAASYSSTQPSLSKFNPLLD